MMRYHLQIDRRILVSSILVALAMFFLIYFLLIPQVKAFTTIKNELTEQRTKLTRYQATAASLKDELKQREAMFNILKENSKGIAGEMRDGAAIILLGNKAASNNLNIISLEPGIMLENRYYLEIPVRLEVQGEYADLITFCKELEKRETGMNDLNISRVRSLKIVPAKNDSHGVYPGCINATIGLVVLSSKNPDMKLSDEDLFDRLIGRPNVFLPLLLE